MNKVIGGLVLAALCSSGAVLAAKSHVPVTIMGCVHPGDHDGEYVLTNVEELVNGQVVPSTVTYWLPKSKGLFQHIGHRVEVTGTYSPERDEGKTARVKIETDKHGEQKIEVKEGGKKVESNLGPVGTTRTKVEYKGPYRRLDVNSIKGIGSSCS